MSAHDRVHCLEQTLSRLLHDPTERQALRNGRLHDVPRHLVGDLRRVDRCPLDTLSVAIVDHVAHRQNRGVGTLKERFPSVFDSWTERHPGRETDLVAHFLRSAYGASWRPLGPAGGVCIEEAFARFATAHGLAPADTVHRHMVHAVGRALTVDPNPRFRPPQDFVGEAGRWIAVIAGDEPELVAAVGGRLITGRVTALVADVLQSPSNLPTDAHQRTAIALRERGLLSEMSRPVQTLYKPVA